MLSENLGGHQKGQLKVQVRGSICLKRYATKFLLTGALQDAIWGK